MEDNEIPNAEDVRLHFEQYGLSQIEQLFEKKLNAWKNVEINIGVVGDSGAGKSSFINAIRGLEDDGENKDAAKTGAKEITREPTEYPHPKNNKIKFWDLPGIGTPDYPDINTYCEKVDLKKYDTFLIFTNSRFTDNNYQIAKKVKDAEKSFLFVRTKIDIDIQNESRKKTFDEGILLNTIRKDCWFNLKELETDDNDVFLISNYNKEKWDFVRLREAIFNTLPTHQKESLTLSLTSLTRDLITRKVQVLRDRIWMVAAASAVLKTVPVPGLPLVFDAVLLSEEMNFYKYQLGIPEKHSKECQGMTSELQTRILMVCTSNAVEISNRLKEHMQNLSSEKIARYIPLVGSTIAGGISFGSTYLLLSECLNKLEATAFEFLDKTSGRVVDDMQVN